MARKTLRLVLSLLLVSSTFVMGTAIASVRIGGGGNGGDHAIVAEIEEMILQSEVSPGVDPANLERKFTRERGDLRKIGSNH